MNDYLLDEFLMPTFSDLDEVSHLDEDLNFSQNYSLSEEDEWN